MQIQPVIGYKMSHASIPTTLTAGSSLKPEVKSTKYPAVFGGDSIVHYELLTPDDSIFQQLMPDSPSANKVGYIRLTRFSRASTAGYIDAVKALEDAGAQSYIIDLRNNYGGVIQEAMLTASTLLRDPHVVLCYTLNSRGGFKPQENMEYIVDKVRIVDTS
jgi:C-terminal processing protease CtpA/Prc